MESVFDRNTEEALIVWHHVYIPLSYKYDVGTILPDIIVMIEQLQSSASGKFAIDWPSNTFSARWVFDWASDCLLVTAPEWRSVVGNTEELLRALPVIELNKNEYVYEWRALLERTRDALLGAGYSARTVPEIDRLLGVITTIGEYGTRYR